MVAVPLMIALVNGPDRLAGHDVLLAAVKRVLPLLLRAEVLSILLSQLLAVGAETTGSFEQHEVFALLKDCDLLRHLGRCCIAAAHHRAGLPGFGVAL